MHWNHFIFYSDYYTEPCFQLSAILKYIGLLYEVSRYQELAKPGTKPGPEVIKPFSMLNSAELEI